MERPIDVSSARKSRFPSKLKSTKFNKAKSKLPTKTSKVTSHKASKADDDTASATRRRLFLPTYIQESDRLYMTTLAQLFNVAAIFALTCAIYFMVLLHAFIDTDHSLLRGDMLLPIIFGFFYNSLLVVLHIYLVVFLHMSKFNRRRIKFVEKKWYRNTKWAVSAVIATSIVVAIIMVPILRSGTQDQFIAEMRKLIKEYLAIVNKRGPQSYDVDMTQQSLKCCGGESYRDWFVDEWSSQLNQGCRNDSRHKYPYIPFSCCDVDSKQVCLPFVPDSSFYPIPAGPLFERNHYRVGCGEKFIYFFSNFIYQMVLCWSISLGISIFTLIALQYLHCSIHFSILWSRRPDNTGIGWIWGPKVNRVNLAGLVYEYRDWKWRLEVDDRKIHENENEDDAFARLNMNEIQTASRFLINDGVIATRDGSAVFGSATDAKKCSEKVIRKVIQSVLQEEGEDQMDEPEEIVDAEYIGQETFEEPENFEESQTTKKSNRPVSR